jgi:hypothetical protein
VIVAIEGTSAAGKTTWCETHAAGCYVPEDPPGPARWRRALVLEREHGIAVCDTEPAKLYYAYALWRTGRIEAGAWRAAREEARAAFADGSLGLPDLVSFAERDLATLERHRASEPGRRRHRFALHVELQPWFVAWWRAVEAAEPGRVRWRYPDGLEELRGLATSWPARERTGAALLDAVLAQLG